MLEKRDPTAMEKVVSKICDQIFTDALDEMIKLKASKSQRIDDTIVPKCTKEERKGLLDNLYNTITDRVYEIGIDGKTFDPTPVARKEFSPTEQEKKAISELLEKMESSIDSFMIKNKEENKISFKEYATANPTRREECIEGIGVQEELKKSPIRKLLENFIDKLVDEVTGQDRGKERTQTEDLTKSAEASKEIVGKFTKRLMEKHAAYPQLEDVKSENKRKSFTETEKEKNSTSQQSNSNHR